MPLTLASFTYNAAWNIGNARGNVGKYWQKLWMQKQWWIWVYISFSQIVSLAYYCYWHQKSPSLPPNLPPPWEMMEAASEKKLFNIFNVKFIFFVDNLKFIGLSDVSGRDTPSTIIIKQAAGTWEATQHHPSWVIKIFGTQKCWLKIMLELESMKWNTSFNCVVLTKRQVCFDSYLWPLSLHKVTIEHAYNWGQKKEGVKRRRCHCFSFRMVLKPRGGVWVVHMWELIRIDVTVSAMNHTGCDWAEFEWWINCWNRVTRQSCKECWVTLRCIWASKCSFDCSASAVTVIECESFIAIVMLSVTVTVLEIFVCCKQRGCLKLAGN